MTKIFLLALVFTVLLSACGVGALDLTNTLSGMQAALNSAPGTFIMQNGEMYFLAWPQGESYAFAVLKSSSDAMNEFLKQANGNGTCLSCLSIAQLVKFLEGSGWQYTSGVSPELAAAIQGVSSWLGVFARAPAIMVVPAGALDNPIIDQYEEREG